MAEETMAEALGKKMDEAHDNDAVLVNIIGLHARTLACHCECLAYNAANMCAAMESGHAVFGREHYIEAMAKWGLVDNNGQPTFNK